MHISILRYIINLAKIMKYTKNYIILYKCYYNTRDLLIFFSYIYDFISLVLDFTIYVACILLEIY